MPQPSPAADFTTIIMYLSAQALSAAFKAGDADLQALVKTAGIDPKLFALEQFETNADGMVSSFCAEANQGEDFVIFKFA